MTSSLIVSSSPLQNAPLQSNATVRVSIESTSSAPASSSSSQFRSLTSESFAPPNKVRRLDGHISICDNPKGTGGSEEKEGVKGKGPWFRHSDSSAAARNLNRADSSYLLPEAEPCHARGSSPKPSLVALPSELVRVIISLVDAPRDRGCCALVCRAWRQWERATRTQLHLRGSLSDLPSLGTCFGSVTDLDLADVHPDWPGSEEELRQVFRTSFPNLRRIRANVSPSGMEYVRQCWPKLESVVIGHWDGLDEGLEARHVSSLVSRCPKVDSIDLSWSRLCDFNELPKQLGDFKLGRIRVLNLLGGPAPLRDDALEVFGRGAFPGLEELSFAMADGGVTDAGISSIARGCPALRVLRIEDVAHDLNDSDVDADGAGGDVDVAGDGDVGGDVASGVHGNGVDVGHRLNGNQLLRGRVTRDTRDANGTEHDLSGNGGYPGVLPLPQVEQGDSDLMSGLSPAAATAGVSATAFAAMHADSPASISSFFAPSAASLASDPAATAAASAAAPAHSAPVAPPVPAACLTYPITASALESLARHCPNLEELCLVPSFFVHNSGPAVEALAAGCKSLRVLRLTRFLGLSRGLLSDGSDGEGGKVVALMQGLGQQQEQQEQQEQQQEQQEEEEVEQGVQLQNMLVLGGCGSVPPSAPFADETLTSPLMADGARLEDWMLWDSAPSLPPPTLDGCSSSSWDVDDALLADWQQWQQVQQVQQVQDEGQEVQNEGQDPLVAAAASIETNSFAPCLTGLPCASTTGSVETNSSGCTSIAGSPRSLRSPPVQPPPAPPVLPPLAQFPALEELELQMCSDMADSDMQAILDGCPQLRRLEVVANHRLSARAFALGCAVCSTGLLQCEAAAAGGSCRARGKLVESVRVMQCDNVDSHALLHALMPARSALKGIQMTASWSHSSPALPLACFSALESLCLEVSVDSSLAPLLSAGLASCPSLKFFFLSLYGSLEDDTLPLPPHDYSLAFLAQPPALTYLFLSLEGIQCSSASAMASLELALLASCPSLPIQEIEFRPAPCPVASPPLCLDVLSPDAARLLSLSPCLRRVTLGGVVQEPALVKLLRSRTLRDVVFLMPPDCSDTFRSFFESVLKSRGYSDQPKRSGTQCAPDACVRKGCAAEV
ncbi:hypothetical protein CLOM_g15308 [Closterium sp. NIES-68]|nr:hypothetical protein CLOM_g15308 [Closterium sp. NIES-68]GJP61392.1 hypothetical protein CLOP_g18560 [Closterium sp. NIES-67]